ncbi:hypothetical protein LINGRAHAP2_LOCUS13969 [Linum grandiflorum]
MEKEESEDLEEKAEKAWRMGTLMEKVVIVASKKYIEAAVNATTTSMRATWKGISSQSSPFS